jgi:mono/diheme cytochrome c family protein
MKTTTLLLSGALLVAPLFTGCGSERRDEPLTDPLTTDDPRVALGHRVFSQHCNQCHPGGAAGLAPAINNKPLPVNLIKTQVRKGLGLMPAFSEREISEEELDGVVRYLKGLRGLKG